MAGWYGWCLFCWKVFQSVVIFWMLNGSCMRQYTKTGCWLKICLVPWVFFLFILNYCFVLFWLVLLGWNNVMSLIKWFSVLYSYLMLMYIMLCLTFSSPQSKDCLRCELTLSVVHSVTFCFLCAILRCLELSKLTCLFRARCEFCWFCYMTFPSSSATTTTLSVMSFRQTASKCATSSWARSLATCDCPIRSRRTWRWTCCLRSLMHLVSCQILSALFNHSHSRRLASLHLSVCNYCCTVMGSS